MWGNMWLFGLGCEGDCEMLENYDEKFYWVSSACVCKHTAVYFLGTGVNDSRKQSML